MAGNKYYIAVLALILGAASVGAAIFGSPSFCPTAGQVQQALQNLQDGQYAQAEREALAVTVNTEGPNPRAWAIVAAARQRSKDYPAAAAAYRQFLSEADCPDARQFAIEQIQACTMQAQPLPAAPQTAPGKRLDAATLGELAKVGDRTYAESTEHFVVRANNPQVAKLVAVEAEVALDRICRVILAGQDYPHSVTISVWPDAKAFHANAAAAPEWAGGGFSYSSEKGLTTRRIDLTQRDAKGKFATVMLDRVLPHEMCHLVLKELFGDSHCPLFLNEGLAMMAESQVENSRVRLAGKTIAGKALQRLDAICLAEQYNVEEPMVFYAESYSFVEFLHGRLTGGQFRDLLANVQQGCTVADAVQRSLYIPAADSFSADLANAWEDHAIAQSQYIEALAAANAPAK
jgi:hypothetical protein